MPSSRQPSPPITKVWWSHSSGEKWVRSHRSAMPMPTPLAKPCPRGPVVTSTPGCGVARGGPGGGCPTDRNGPEVVELEAVAGQVQHRVEQDPGVAVGQHEPVPVRPVRIGRVVAHDPGEQHMGQRGQRHRRARMSGVGGPRGVHGQAADDVDGHAARVRHSGGRGQVVAEAAWASAKPYRPAQGRGQRRSPGLSLPEQGQGGGEAVHEVGAADRAELSGHEHAAQWDRTEPSG